jgi:hypothetical protein
MGRLWLVLAFIAALAEIASADREQVCTCRRDVTLPRQGATGVPTNARLWRFIGLGVVGTPSQRIQVYELAPHTTYELTSPQLRFTTGDGPDDAPPAQPTVTGVTITVHGTNDIGGGPATLLHLAATFDADTAVVRIEIDDHASHTTLYTTPDDLSICDPGFSINDGFADVKVTAIDLAGNVSPPVTFPTHPIIDASSGASCVEDHHHSHGTDYIAYFLLAPFVLALAYIIGLAITAHTRANLRGRIEAAPLAITAAEALARGIRRRALISIALLLGGSALTFHSAIVEVLMLYASPIVVIVILVELVRWIGAGLALRLASYDGATATVRRDEVRITVGGKHATLRAAPWRVERAKEHGVPRATL